MPTSQLQPARLLTGVVAGLVVGVVVVIVAISFAVLIFSGELVSRAVSSLPHRER
ncbi:MAG: hypothetical protein ACE5GX_17530 [Thermoanaerobaculia bacterium]